MRHVLSHRSGLYDYTDDMFARAYDAVSGAVLWQSGEEPGASIGSASAVAGHHLLVNHYGVLVAYRLPQDGA